jgi:hypothetical protein
MKKKYSRRQIFTSTSLLAMAIALLFLAACTFENPTAVSERINYVDKELNLVDITNADVYSHATPGLRATGAKAGMAKAAAAPGDAVIKLIAEVSPPEDDKGRELQASHVALTSNGKYAIVTYMLRGAEVSGALDIFNVSTPSKPKLLRTILFPDFDIAAVVEETGTLFLAGQTPNVNGNSARVVSLSFSSAGAVDLASQKSVQLPGYFATDLVRQNNLLFVTTGTYSPNQPAAGLYALDPDTLAISKSATNGYPDARSVAVDGSDVAVFEAQYSSPSALCRLDIYDNGDLASTPTSVDLSSYPATAEAKAKLTYFEAAKLFLVATNRSGVAIIDAQTKRLKAGIPAPNLAANIVPLENQSSNAVSIGDAGGKDIVFIANGEAGLWVGDGDLIKKQTTSTTASINGTIRFGVGESVNFVASMNTLAVAAVGTGGLKIITIQK